MLVGSEALQLAVDAFIVYMAIARTSDGGQCAIPLKPGTYGATLSKEGYEECAERFESFGDHYSRVMCSVQDVGPV